MPLKSNEEVLKEFEKVNPILEKHLGEDVFVSEEIKPVARMDTGFAVINHILGGGLPWGRLVELFGPESTGKSTLAVQILAHEQHRDENFRVLLLDFEQTMTIHDLHQLGMIVKRPRLFFAQPRTIEEGAMLVKLAVEKGWVRGVIWDTPAASQPAATINNPLTEKEMREGYRDIEKGKSDTGTIGLHSRVFSYAVAAFVPMIARNDCIMVLPNQLRTTINTWGAGETTPGGRALKFYASQRIRLSKKQTVKESLSDDFLGTKQATAVENLVQMHCVKNKTAPPFRLCDVRLKFDKNGKFGGFLDKETLLDLAVRRKIVAKAGGGNFSMVNPDGTELFKVRGTDALIELWESDQALYDKVRAALMDTEPGEDEIQEYKDAEELEEMSQAQDTDPDEDEVAGLAEGSTRF